MTRSSDRGAGSTPPRRKRAQEEGCGPTPRFLRAIRGGDVDPDTRAPRAAARSLRDGVEVQSKIKSTPRTPEVGTMEAISDTGALERTPLPRLLLALSNARFDGCLHLQRERVEKTFRFQRGAPISAESTLASETLGLWLLDSRRISRDDYHKVSAYVAENRVKEGVALLELGLLDPKSLFLALKEQVRARLVECFGWPRGNYRVEREHAAPEGALPFRADLVGLIQEGIETHWNAERVLSDLATPMSQIAVPVRRLAAISERLRRDPAVDALLEELDGTHTLWHAIQRARSPRALAAAWVIDAMGGLEYRAHDVEKPAEAEVEAEVEIVLTETAAPATA